MQCKTESLKTIKQNAEQIRDLMHKIISGTKKLPANIEHEMSTAYFDANNIIYEVGILMKNIKK